MKYIFNKTCFFRAANQLFSSLQPVQVVYQCKKSEQLSCSIPLSLKWVQFLLSSEFNWYQLAAYL